MILERALRARNYAEARVEEADRMAFRARERAEAIIANNAARYEAKALAEAGDGEKRGENVREGYGIRIDKIGEKKATKEVSKKAKDKKVVVKDKNVKEEVRGPEGASASEVMTATEAVAA